MSRQIRMKFRPLVWFALEGGLAYLVATVANRPWHWVIFSGICLFALLHLGSIVFGDDSNRN